MIFDQYNQNPNKEIASKIKRCIRLESFFRLERKGEKNNAINVSNVQVPSAQGSQTAHLSNQ